MMKIFVSPREDRRLWLCALVPAFCFALFTVVGVPLNMTRELPALTLGSFLLGTLAAGALTLLYALLLTCFYR